MMDKMFTKSTTIKTKMAQILINANTAFKNFSIACCSTKHQDENLHYLKTKRLMQWSLFLKQLWC